MAADGKITLTVSGGNTIDIAVPLFGYRSVIEFPFDFARADDGSFDSFDHGTAYDRRFGEFSLELDATDMGYLSTFLSSNLAANGRGRSIVLTMSTGSGLFPFGPDKGDTGPFTVAAEIVEHGRTGAAPWQHFNLPALRIRNTGAWPAYSLPTQVHDGPMTIGTVTNVRFPDDWFQPEPSYGLAITPEEDGSVQVVDRTSGADSYITRLPYIGNESKTAAILAYLNATARNGNFALVVPNTSYPFGYDKGTGGTYTVKLAQNRIEVTHMRYNEFAMDLTLSYVSGPA